MAKVIDDSGFWSIKDNPISKEGVFPYLGRNISPELEPDKIYMVYRPIEELSADETITSFNGVPFIDNHEMIGEGFTPYDERPAGGVLMNPRTENGVMYGDFKIYSEDLKEKILNGKKELSLGYLCDYEVKRGVWNGKPYDAIQKHLRGNHIALVDNARMGKDCRVYDRAITFDSLDIEIPEKQDDPEKSGLDSSLTHKGEDEMADKREAIREVMAIASKPNSDFEGGEAEKIETIAKILEKSEYSKSEAGTANDEEEKEELKAEDKCGKDEEEKEDSKAEDEDDKEKSEAEDEAENDDDKKETEDEDEDEEEKKNAMDSMSRQVLKMIARRNEIVKAVEPLIGSFACDEMTDVDASVYACKKLGLQVTKDEAPLVLKGYLTATKVKQQKVYGLDSADFTVGIDKATEKYLKGE